MSAIRTLLEGIVDYAGLFPPAALPMQPVVRKYASYRAGPRAWMLGRIICPAGRLGEFAAEFEGLADAARSGSGPWHVSVLGRGGGDAAAWLAGLDQDLADVKRLEDRLCGAVVADAFEGCLPRAMVEAGDVGSIGELVRAISERIGSAGTGLRAVAMEIPFAGDWRRNVPGVIGAIAEFNRARAGGEPIAAKIRTGGVEAHQFPSVEQVACWIRACCDCGVAFKATAGLHHPVRRFNEGVGTPMHGFLNVFCAAVLADHVGLGEDEIVMVLSDEAPHSFQFDAEGLAWRDRRASVEQVAATRLRRALSFGSCSFNEPVEDLEALGLLERS